MPGRLADALFDDGTVALWIEPPNMLFTQVRTSHYTMAHVTTFVGPIMDRVRRALNVKRFIWVSDSRRILTYESGSRVALTKWGVERKQELDRIVILVSPTHKIMLMGAHVAATAAALHGMKMTIVKSMDALKREGIPWPGIDDDA